MMTDTPESVTLVPIDRIEVLNSRDRNMKVFEEIVENIRSIGLKKPITVTEREGADGAPAYLLVCGEGRLNAFRLLGESHIPALVVNVTDEDAFIMSLAENIARKGHRPLEILADIELLLARDYNIDDIITRTGLSEKYVRDIVFLLEKGEERLIEAVQNGTIPLTTALEIARAKHDDENLGDMLEEAYKTGQLKGHQITDAKRLIEKRREKGPKTGGDRPKLPNSAHSLVKTYQREVARQHKLMLKADQDHQFTPDVTRHLRKMKAARQIEAVELMIAAHTITAAHADALLKATPPEQRTDYKPPQPEQPKGDPLEQIVKLEREMSQVQEKYKHAEENYGSELLNLVVAKGYLKKLMENEAVRSYVARHASEILEQFELVLNTVSMEEAVEQAEREDGPIAAGATAQAQLAEDNSEAASAPGMDGKLG